MKPKISVVIPTYNRPDNLSRALLSVLNQTFKDFEVIIVDDGMDRRVNKSIEDLDGRIRLISHSENKGAPAARNTGINNAQADWVAFLDDDDEYLPDKLEEQYKVIEKYGNEIDFVFCGANVFHEAKNKITPKTFHTAGIHNFYDLILGKKIQTLTSSLIIKKSALEVVGGFDQSFPSNQEWDLMIRISKNGKGYYIDKKLLKINIGLGEHVGGNLSRRILGRKLILEKHFNVLKDKPQLLFWHYFALGHMHRNNDQFKEAKDYFRKSWRLQKLRVKVLLFYFLMFGGGVIYKILIKVKRKLIKWYDRKNKKF